MKKGIVINFFAKCSVLIFMFVALAGIRSQAQEAPQVGTASYYANKFNGRKTANGEIFNNNDFTAAHNKLPLGTYVKVTNLRNHKWVIVRITDRLHYANKRVVDLTQAAAKRLGFYYRGLTKVKVEVVNREYASSIITAQELSYN